MLFIEHICNQLSNQKDWGRYMQSVHLKEKAMMQGVILAVFSLLVSVVCLGVMPGQAHASDIDVNGSTATVYSSAGLKSALENTQIDTVEFANDIAITNSAHKKICIASKRANANLVIDGKGFTLTEWYDSSCSTAGGMALESKGTVDTITVKNMVIIGGNTYGTIRVAPAGVTQYFDNVNYTGPQMVHNPCGYLNIKDSTIAIAKAQGKGTAQQEVAEVASVTLEGTVDISRSNDTSACAYPFFHLTKAKGGIYVADGAQITANNPSTGASGFVSAACAYDFSIGNNAVFSYNGFKTFDKSCALSNFTVGTGSKVAIAIDGKLDGKIISACGSVKIGSGSDVDLSVAGDNCGTILHAKCGIDLAEGANVAVDISGKNGCIAVYSACGNITINANADLSVNAYGYLSCPLMKVVKTLYVGDGAVLDLIAHSNSNSCCNYVFYACGCSSKMTYANPERVLFYNGSTSSSKCNASYAAYLGSTKIDFDVYSTKYWTLASQSGGPNVLTNPTKDWSQDSNYQVSGCAFCSTFCSFKVLNYNGSINAKDYYFGKKYQVCLWQGKGEDPKAEVSLTYDPNDAKITDAAVVEQYLEGDATTIINNPFASSPWTFVEWSTSPNVGQGTIYAPGASLTITEDTVLYAHWKSRVPAFNVIFNTDTAVTGTGIPGSTITVYFPSGAFEDVLVAFDGTWTLALPATDPSLATGATLYASQTEVNKYVSDVVSKSVSSSGTRAPIPGNDTVEGSEVEGQSLDIDVTTEDEQVGE